MIRGEKYVGERKQRTFKGAYLFSDENLRQRMVFDWIEIGLDISHTTTLLSGELTKDNIVKLVMLMLVWPSRRS